MICGGSFNTIDGQTVPASVTSMFLHWNIPEKYVYIHIMFDFAQVQILK